MNIFTSLLNEHDFRAQVKHQSRTVDAHTKILTQGEITPYIYLIQQGRVRIKLHGDILRDNEDIKHIHPGVAELGENDLFGEFGLIDKLPASADVVTITETQFVEIDAASFQQYLKNNPAVSAEIYLLMLQKLVQYLRKADKTIVNLLAWGMKSYELDKHL